MERLKFLDDFRGLAIAAMVVNHVGHYLAPQFVSYPIYLMIYLSVTIAAPVFLFVSGFSLSLSWQKFSESAEAPKKFFRRCLKRGAILIVCGYLINLFFFFDEPIFRSRVLFFLGLASILTYPVLLLLKKKFGPALVLTSSLAVLIFFQFFAPAINGLFSLQPILADVFLSEFPLLPWLSVYIIGLLFGRKYLELSEVRRDIMIKISGAVGFVLIFFWLVLSVMVGRFQFFSFTYDLALNAYWTPDIITWFWTFGWIMLGLFCLYQMRKDFPVGDNILTVLGKNALAAYFIHFFLIRTVGESWLKIESNDPLIASILIIIIIIILWILLKSNQFAKLMASVRVSRKAKTS